MCATVEINLRLSQNAERLHRFFKRLLHTGTADLFQELSMPAKQSIDRKQERANWWFTQMRAVVDKAIDWQAKPNANEIRQQINMEFQEQEQQAQEATRLINELNEFERQREQHRRSHNWLQYHDCCEALAHVSRLLMLNEQGKV